MVPAVAVFFPLKAPLRTSQVEIDTGLPVRAIV